MDEIEIRQKQTRDELKTSHATQDSLLQSYRSISVTHQALSATTLMVIFGVFENMKSFFEYKEAIVANFISATLISIYAVVLIYGIYATSNFKEAVERRQKYINILEFMMKMEENGYLGKRFKEVNFNHPIPISNIFDLIAKDFDQENRNKNFYQFSTEQKNLIIDIINEADIENKNNKLRNKFNNILFDLFNAIWFISGVYFITKFALIVNFLLMLIK